MIAIPQHKPRSQLKAKIFSPISKRHKLRYAIGLEPEPIRRVFADCIMSNDKKLLFTKNSKAGCTSISQMLVHYSTGEFSSAVHEKSDGAFSGEADYHNIRRGFDSDSTYCFTMVRNPLNRFKSAFINILLDKNNGAFLANRLALVERGYKDEGDINYNLEVFVDFVEEALSDTRLYCDPHWREQHINIGCKYLPYNFVAKLENFNNDMQHVFTAAGLESYLSTIDTNKKYNPSTPLELNIPTNLKRKIEKLYEKDYGIFEY